MSDWTQERIAAELRIYETTRKYAVCGRCMGHGEYEEGTGQPSDDGGELSRILTCEVCQGTGAHPLGVGTGDALRALSAAQDEIARRDSWIACMIAALCGKCESSEEVDRIVRIVTEQSGYAARPMDAKAKERT